MKKRLLLVSILCAAILAPGCTDPSKATIKLDGNPTTGYTWVYTISPEGVIKEFSNDYKTDSNIFNYNKSGIGGTFIFVFEAAAPGEAEIVFSYLRVWEEDKPPLATEVYKAVVDSNNRLTLTLVE